MLLPCQCRRLSHQLRRVDLWIELKTWTRMYTTMELAIWISMERLTAEWIPSHYLLLQTAEILEHHHLIFTNRDIILLYLEIWIAIYPPIFRIILNGLMEQLEFTAAQVYIAANQFLYPEAQVTLSRNQAKSLDRKARRNKKLITKGRRRKQRRKILPRNQKRIRIERRREQVKVIFRLTLKCKTTKRMKNQEKKLLLVLEDQDR
mmetsp:Transcript_3815/g.5697  ORF Transcript_3815/g.5697 Transcript_3815/m.5697 type:complete len:205 (+) Transcript_3815:38-652(+)